MVLVKTQADTTFDMDPAWLPMFFCEYPFKLDIANQDAAEEILKYAREEEARKRRFKISKIAKEEAVATGQQAIPITFTELNDDGQPDGPGEIGTAMLKNFASSLSNDHDLLVDVLRAAFELEMMPLYNGIIEEEVKRMVATGFNGYTDEVGPRAYLNVLTQLF